MSGRRASGTRTRSSTRSAAAAKLTATAPALIAEVLSPSSATLDLGDKAAEYLRLVTLQAYVVLAQDEPKAWLWVHGPHGFAAGPQVMTGTEAVIRVPALGIALPLADIYGKT
jgi:Uma2 family endonuclease